MKEKKRKLDKAKFYDDMYVNSLKDKKEAYRYGLQQNKFGIIALLIYLILAIVVIGMLVHQASEEMDSQKEFTMDMGKAFCKKAGTGPFINAIQYQENLQIVCSERIYHLKI